MKYTLKAILTLFIACIVNCAFAQHIDTVWYNKQNIETKQVQDRDHYKTIKPNQDKTAFEVTGYNHKGQIMMIAHFSSLNPDVKNGEFISYNDKGSIISRLNFKNDIVSEVFNYENGKQTRHIVNTNNPPAVVSNDSSIQYQSFGPPLNLDSTPLQYYGGDKAINDFIGKHLVYPKDALKAKIQGTVMVEIKVNEAGAITGINTLRNPPHLLAEEALRVIKLLPNKWIPGKAKDGKPIANSFIIPIKFSL